MDGATLNAAPRKPPSRWDTIKEKLKGGVNISLLASFAVHIAMIVIGSMNLRKCPVENNIPLFLVVAGVIGVVTKLISLFRNFLVKHIKFVKISTILSMIFTVELLFFIYGSYWVYKEYKPSYNSRDIERYCDKTTYLFALVYISITYALLFVFVLILVCIICTILACERCVDKFDEEAPSETRLAATSRN